MRQTFNNPTLSSRDRHAPRRLWAYLLVLIVEILSLTVDSTAFAYNVQDNAILHQRQGQLLMERGQFEDAIEEFKNAIQLNPYASMTAPLYNNLGLAYQAVGQYPMALVSFQRACRIQPTYAIFYKHLIDTYAKAGQLPQAETALKDTLALNAADAEAWFLLGLLYQQQGQSTSASTCFERFLKLQPESDLAQAAQQALRSSAP